MTGQEFIDALHKAIQERGQLDKEYTAHDLNLDASTLDIWHRRTESYAGQVQAQQNDVDAAKKETSEKLGGGV